MDKQIIIDGVDVSGCKYYQNDSAYNDDNDLVDNEGACQATNGYDSYGELCYIGTCKNRDCYYKQLKRKEQECEELKAKFQDMKKSRDIALKEYNEEFEYKRQITVEHLEQKKELLKQLDQLKFDYAELEKRHNDSFEQFKQLKSELTRANCQIADDEILQCDMREAIEALKSENKHLNDLLNQALKELEKTRETLTEIKPILEYYEDSKIGEKQEDGSYKFEFTFSDIATPFCINYDPKPAREALRKINEVENDICNANK